MDDTAEQKQRRGLWANTSLKLEHNTPLVDMHSIQHAGPIGMIDPSETSSLALQLTESAASSHKCGSSQHIRPQWRELGFELRLFL